MIALLRYTTLRLALFLVAFFILIMLGVEPIFAAIGGILTSAVLSLFLLKRQRQALSLAVATRSTKWRDRIHQATTKEDLD